MRSSRLLCTLRCAAAMAACFGYAFWPAEAATLPTASVYVSPGSARPDVSVAASAVTVTPIKHLVVIFQENVSFDHYFGTYPHAANPPGEPSFTPLPDTPSVNGLRTDLLTHNPNLVQPFRLDRSQSMTCDQDHDYTDEQKAFDGGKMDKFVQYTSGSPSNFMQYCPYGSVMGYYDGNTVTGLWNYAQHYAMSDNSFGTVFGPSTPGVLNLVGADTSHVACGGVAVYNPPAACSPGTPPATTLTSGTGGSVTGDPDQYYDDCSAGGYGSARTAAIAQRNVGDILNSNKATWGWFNGGFSDCKAAHPAIAIDRYWGINPARDKTTLTADYSAHHEGFQYYASTSNPRHVKPGSVSAIGATDPANHQYDLTDFWAAADAGNLPAVSYLKAPKYQDGHAGYSDPLDEQEFLTTAINHLQSLPSWATTAIVIAYDDSDGWYDHVASPVVNHSNTRLDVGCGATSDAAPARCGYGPRLPLLVISPYARSNYVDHTLTDQTSIAKFVEDNWAGGIHMTQESFDNRAGSLNSMFDFTAPVASDGHRLYLDPLTGQPLVNAGGSGSITVTFTSTNAGQGYVDFGPSCSALFETATNDETSGSTTHTVVVTGNDYGGTVGDVGIVPGTYYYRVMTVALSGVEIDNNGGKCYQVTVPGA